MVLCFKKIKRREEISKLVENKENIKYDYMNLCAENNYLYLLKSTDKRSLYTRIDKVERLVKRYLL